MLGQLLEGGQGRRRQVEPYAVPAPPPQSRRTERLVAVVQPRLRTSENEMLYPSRLFWLSLTPAGWRTEAVATRSGLRASMLERGDVIGRPRSDRAEDYDPILAMPRETFTAGPVDAADPSHFTLRYRVEGWEIRDSKSVEWEGADGLIEGWLQDDGTLRMRFTRTAQIPAPPFGPDLTSQTSASRDDQEDLGDLNDPT